MPKFTQDWLHNKGIIEYWEKHLSNFKDKRLYMLEIGSFEGMSTLWFLNNILTHPASHIDCVDTFEGDGQQKSMGVLLTGIKERFVENTQDFAYKITIIQNDSQKALYDLPSPFYDLIYIDGSHYQTHVLHDAVMSWDRLKLGGVMIFDDYGMAYTDKNNVKYNPKIAIDAFISVYKPELKIIHSQWQMIIKKI